MERDFTYLREKYKVAGAREAFEDICAEVLALEHGPEKTHQIRVTQGDGGIDVLVGDFSHPAHIFQCKFFEKLEASQKDQIRDSFKTARENSQFTMDKWTLCVSLQMSGPEMEWWSTWKKKQETKYSISISLLDSSDLITLLKKHNIYERVFDIDTQRIMNKLEEFLDNKDLTGIAELLDSERIAGSICKPEHLKRYYKGDNGFSIMLPVICAGEDIPMDGADETIRCWLTEGNPVIITGYGCTGKTSLMLRSAVSWVRTGKCAVWLSLEDDISLKSGEISTFYKRLEQIVQDSKGPVLLCLDAPADNPELLIKFRERFPSTGNIRLMMAERRNRLDHLADPSQDILSDWFSDAKIAVLEGTNQQYTFKMDGYICHSFHESYQRREKILRKSISLHAPDKLDEVRYFLKDFARPTTSILELIYRVLFTIKKQSQNPNIKLDWDEWTAMIRSQLGKNHQAKNAYALIAACSQLGIPMSVDLLCRYYKMDTQELLDVLLFAKQTQYIEPIIYLEKSRRLKPKHDIAAQLYFLFHPHVTPDSRIFALLDVMTEIEVEALLREIVTSRRLRYSSRNSLELSYREYMHKLLERHRTGTLNLFGNNQRLLCLGFLWAQPVDSKETLDILDELAPPADDTPLSEKLYTAWGKLLAQKKRNIDAERCFREVLKSRPIAVAPRTELGRLLSKMGRDDEAEKVLREVLNIDKKHIQSRTELGRLFSKLGRDDEAETILREILTIDKKHIHSRTELGRLLAKQPEHEAEAEQFFLEAIALDNSQKQPRTELGRLLSQLGKYDEAEKVLKEVIDIDENNIQARTELGKLYSKLGKNDEAEKVLKEVLNIDKNDVPSRTVLGKLLAKQSSRELEAEQYFRDAIRLDKNQIHSRNELAMLLTRRGDTEGAEVLYHEILDIDSKNDYAIRNLANLSRK